MIHLSDLFDIHAFEEATHASRVRVQHHPSEPLSIANYTAQTQWEKAWDNVTRQCRGLIFNNQTLEVVARPWPKFFNWGELVDTVASEQVREFSLDEPVRVFDKMDGSLGIAYTIADGTPFIATRGSFTSDQSFYANKILLEKYPDWRPEPDLTYLFEIIHPNNRIVVDYRGMEDLVLLDILETDTGEPAIDYAWMNWEGPWVDELNADTLREALELEPRPNAEGIVVKFEDDHTMLKIKQEDYVALHRIVTGLNERTVWETLSTGGSVGELAKQLPEEFQSWVLDVGGNLMGEFLRIKGTANNAYQAVLMSCKSTGDEREKRKEFASYARVAGDDYTSLLFMLLDGKDIEPAIWKQLRPFAPKPLMHYSEDVA